MKLVFFKEHSRQEIQLDELDDYLKKKNGSVWVDMTGPTEQGVELLRAFDFHPLAIEDTRNQRQRPKAEEFSDHLFIILNPVNDGASDNDLVRELDVFVGQNFMVTAHAREEPLWNRVWARLDPDRVGFSPSSTYLLYALLDEVVDGYLPLLEQIEDELVNLGNRVFANPDQGMLSRLFQLQQTLGSIGRVLGPQQDVINVLMNHPLVFIEQDSQYHLRDILDHVLRATDMVRTLRETVNSLLNLYISTVSYRLNRVVNRLTLLAVIVGSMTVISGFYGMNFESTWPPFSAWWGVPAVMLMMLAAVAYVWFSHWREKR